MRTLPRLRAPLWFHLLCAVVCAGAWRLLDAHAPGLLGPPHAPGDPQMAFWTIFVIIVEAIWKGFEAAGRVTLAVLAWSVQVLWKFATLIYDGAKQLSQWAWVALRKGWDLLKLTYENVLKPGWEKVWHWVDLTKTWLEHVFGPVLRWLRFLRTWVLEFYVKFVRPILDIIEISRRALRVLSSLGVDWARRLDAELARLEARIEAPFLLVLRKLNEVINIVNRIMTADGLFQRLTFLRTLGRDVKLAWNTLWNNLHHPLTDKEKEEAQAKVAGKPLEKVFGDVRTYMQTKDGADAALFDEMTTQWRKQLQLK